MKPFGVLASDSGLFIGRKRTQRARNVGVSEYHGNYIYIKLITCQPGPGPGKMRNIQFILHH